MAGNLQADNSGDILVDFDYNNLIVVDPNKTIDSFGKIRERIIDHENLVMYANLEAEVIPRTKLSVGGSPEDRIRTISVAKINFLKPTKNSYLGTGYYDELTGENSTKYEAINQPKQVSVNPGNGEQPYIINSVADQTNIIDTGLLGITSIAIRTSTSFIPSVSIRLEDVQGRALFQLGNDSPYSAFFNLPYCPFYLTLKGYYGQAIRYQLNLEKFNASFNSFSGNYIIDLEFKGYKFNILNEISFGHLLAAPHMYSQRFQVTQSPTEAQNANQSKDATSINKSGIGTNSTNNVTTEIVSERGYQKVVEIYSEYKAKGLVDPDFPELTVQQLMNKLENFEQAIVNSYKKSNVEPLTNIRTYKQKLTDYFANVRGSDSSWFNTYCNNKPIILIGGQMVYSFKENLDDAAKQEAQSKLSDLVARYNLALAENQTLGKNKTSPIENPIKIDGFYIDVNYSDINWPETVRYQTGTVLPTPEQEELLKKSIEKQLVPIIETDKTGLPKKVTSPRFIIFEGDKKFDKNIANMETQATAKLAEVEGIISADLARKIEDKATGLGFKPTVRNIVAVIMASAEAFIRLLDDVHTNSWNVKYDPVRKNAILDNPSSAPGSDTIDNVSISISAQQSNQGLSTSQIPVYPWPQFFVETPEDKKGRFQLKYIADPSVVNLTKGYLYDKWPEVEFVEEYMKGLTQKFQNPTSQPSLDTETKTLITNVNAIEYPNVGIAYVNKEEIKFFYEIWERQYLTSFYSGYVRLLGNSNGVGGFSDYSMKVETDNLVKSLGGSSPFLTVKLKNLALNANNYVSTLETISNQGTGRSYQDFIRDFYVTPYIKALTDSPFSILNLNETGKIPASAQDAKALQSIIKTDYNTPMLLDTYPFTNPQWCLKNMDKALQNPNELVYNTNNTYKIYSQNNVIANFDTITDYTTNRPVTNFSYLNVTNPSTTVVNGDLNIFYTAREPQKFVPTEGYCYFPSPVTPFPAQTTTSMLNTPYFINAIQNGVYNSRTSDPYPYIQAAYLFINSLPLDTLRERYKTYSNGVTNDLDYIASVFKKFGAVHKVPYAWVLKMGSIWYRYKKYIETNVDILDTCWKDFDYVTNYDPITSSVNHEYNYSTKINGVTVNQQIVLQNETTDTIKIQNGFYPKVINDFNVFYNGYDLYQTYSNEEIQASMVNGMKIVSLSDGQITATQKTKNLKVQPYSVVIPHLMDTSNNNQSVCVPSNNTKGGEYYVIPSFGNIINQTNSQCINATGGTIVDLTYNQSMYNGSVRLLWSAPNYGYFDTYTKVKPKPDSYLNYIDPLSSNQSPLSFLSGDTYSKIEEIFSVFNKSILNQFETEFLNFCKPINTLIAAKDIVGLGESPFDINANFKNFQSFMRVAMTVPTMTGTDTNQYFLDTINNQLQVFSSNIKNFMEYDVILRNGNPGNYNRRIFGSFVGTATDPIKYNPYVIGSLPTLNGQTTLSQSKANYPLQWAALQTEVGFSTIVNLEYTNQGSYITDFFVDNNVEFSTQNITLYAELIKVYATRKLLNPSITPANFKTQINSFISDGTNLQNIILNKTMEALRASLPNQSQLPERTIQSVIDGQQSKVENYEVFKGLNDKWIAGGDYKNKTLFEDMLFLDRASRNIGNTIIIDIFDLQNILNKNAYNERMSVFTLISGILIKNNFNVMPLPAYVNFYNVQDVSGINTPQKSEGSLEFANSMWGTFLNVDYRNSGPKMICFYAGKPSEYLKLPKGNSRFRDDSFEMRKASENPLIENIANKKDYALSNRCVGFNVDIGVRNQNVFYSFSVSQEAGKATSETIETQLNMINQASGRNVATQNVSLYNLYKNRSYTCTVQCLGNALLQPTMYFNLQHVPMFNGPYMITEISHNITPGNFETTITGVRQGIFDLPAIDNFLQSINKNLLTKIEQAVLNKKDETPAPGATTDTSKAAKILQKAENSYNAQNACKAKLLPIYDEQKWESTPTVLTSKSTKELRDAITGKTSNTVLQTIIYTICYVRSFQGTGSKPLIAGWNNNFAAVTLDIDYGNSNIYFTKKYSCLEVQAGESPAKSNPNTLPIANFESIDKFIDFMVSRLSPNVQRIQQIGIPKYYVCYWPINNVTPEYYESNKNLQFKKLLVTFDEAYASATGLGLPNLDGTYNGVSAVPTKTIDSTCTVPVLNGVTLVSGSLFTYNYATPTNCLSLVLAYSRDKINWNYDTGGCNTGRQIDTKDATKTWYFKLIQNCTTGGHNDSNIVSYTYVVKGEVICLPPIISSFTPTFGGTNTILTIKGKYLESTTAIKINDVEVVKGIIKSSDGTQLTVTVPQSPLQGIQDNFIMIIYRDSNGIDASITSNGKFTYNPAITNTNAPAAQLNTKNVSQQTDKELSDAQSATRQDGLTGPKVLIDTITTNPIKGFESLSVKVNTDPTLGIWVINQNVNIKVQLISFITSGNNTVKEEVIKEINFISENGFVLNNSVYITSTQITKLIVESNDITDEEWKKTNKILGLVDLTTIPADKNKQPLWTTYKFTMLKS
jgi:hypothetical protein